MTKHDSESTLIPARRVRRGAVAIAAASAFSALFATAAPAAGADAQAPEAQRPIGPQLQAILDRAVAAPDTSPGVALRVRVPGHGTWSGAAGHARLEHAAPMRAHYRFRAGSIVKPFVAATTLKLVEEGRFGLDDALPAVLPRRVIARFPDASRITVRMLLNHTSGVGDYTDARFKGEIEANPGRRWRTSELLDRAAAQPPYGAPGARFAYSNTNYNLLGLVIERATGKPWRAVVRDRVIERLGLRRTSLPQPGRRPAGDDVAHGYRLVDGRLLDMTGVDSSMAGAAGGHALMTTTEDLSRFLRAALAGTLFERPETLEAMRAFVPGDNANGRVGYGLGLERYLLPGGVEMVGHMGTTGGYRALMFHLPASGVDFTMVTTRESDPLPVLLPALQLLLAEAS